MSISALKFCIPSSSPATSPFLLRRAETPTEIPPAALRASLASLPPLSSALEKASMLLSNFACLKALSAAVTPPTNPHIAPAATTNARPTPVILSMNAAIPAMPPNLSAPPAPAAAFAPKDPSSPLSPAALANDTPQSLRAFPTSFIISPAARAAMPNFCNLPEVLSSHPAVPFKPLLSAVFFIGPNAGP